MAHQIPCPNQCEFPALLAGRQLEEHLTRLCPYQPVICPYDPACPVSVMRFKAAEHLAGHLREADKRVKALEEQLTRSQKEASHLKQRLDLFGSVFEQQHHQIQMLGHAVQQLLSPAPARPASAASTAAPSKTHPYAAFDTADFEELDQKVMSHLSLQSSGAAAQGGDPYRAFTASEVESDYVTVPGPDSQGGRSPASVSRQLSDPRTPPRAASANPVPSDSAAAKSDADDARLIATVEHTSLYYGDVSRQQAQALLERIPNSYLVRDCGDPSELIDGRRNPNLFVLSYMVGAELKNAKMFRLAEGLCQTKNKSSPVYKSLQSLVDTVSGSKGRIPLYKDAPVQAPVPQTIRNAYSAMPQ